MSSVRSIICVSCQHQNDVVPVVVDGLSVTQNGAGFIPEACSQCRRILRPSTDEWNSILFALVAGGQHVPPEWWQLYARRHPPEETVPPTA